MQFTIDEAKKGVKLKDIAVAVPKSIYATQVFGKELELEKCCLQDCSGFELNQMWTQQHPLIHTWLVFSLLSICFLSPLLFIIH